MIGWLKGTVVERTAEWAIIEAGGVGYKVHCPAGTRDALPPSGGTATLFVHTHVRENEITLFGFAGRLEKELFERLISVSDIGPRKAVGILSGTGPAELIRAIRTGNLAVLVALPGVGKKTAERLIVEMRDRIKDLDEGAPAPGGETALGARDELYSALVNLGYRPAQAEKAVDNLRGRIVDGAPLEALIPEALAEMKKMG